MNFAFTSIVSRLGNATKIMIETTVSPLESLAS
jgi:hypothetical protein